MSVYERIEILRKERGLSQGKLEKELGFSNGSISKWKKSAPTTERLQKVADYFNVSVPYLLGTEGQSKPAYYSDQDTADLAQAIYDSRELRLLFDAAKDAKAEDLEFTYEMLMRLKKKEDHDDDDAC
jgi:transcriptional regulator with XRE-family HTH domain